MSNTMRNVIVAALLGITAGCGGTSPVGPAVVTPAPVAPAPVVPVSTYTLTPSASAVAPGAQLSVSWTASIGGRGDTIALYKKGIRTLPLAGGGKRSERLPVPSR